MAFVNPGSVRVTIMTPERKIAGLHVCANCITIIRHAWPPDDDSGGRAVVLASASPWQGPCDLCRYTTALVGLLNDPAPEHTHASS